MTRDELLDLLRERGGTRQTVIRVLEGEVSRDDVVFEKESIEVEDEAGIRTVEWYGTRSCDSCGHSIDQQTSVSGGCSVCQRIVCSSEGCAHRCTACGVLLCARHAHVFKNGDGEREAYCPRHAWQQRVVRFLKAVFG